MTMRCVTDWSSSSSFTIMYIKIRVDTVLSKFQHTSLFPSSQFHFVSETSVKTCFE